MGPMFSADYENVNPLLNLINTARAFRCHVARRCSSYPNHFTDCIWYHGVWKKSIADQCQE